MADWIEVSSQTSGSWLYLLALPAVILVAFAVYGRTRPAVSAPMRKVLWILRAVTLAFLLLLLTDPVIELTGKRTALPCCSPSSIRVRACPCARRMARVASIRLCR